MNLLPEQTAAIASWVAAGDNLSTIQKKLAAHYNLTLTYMDVRFLVDDLNLTLRDAPPPAPAAATAQTNLAQPAPRQTGQQPRSASASPFDDDDLDATDIPPGAQHPAPPPPQNVPRETELYDEDDAAPPQMPEGPPDAPAPADYADDDANAYNAANAPANVRVEVDNVTLNPNALASGSVTFTDGVTGNWFIDQYGRPSFTQISRPNYRPTQTDWQAFMQQLAAALQKKGLM